MDTMSLPFMNPKHSKGGRKTLPEVFDLCGTPLPPGTTTKPIGPNRKVYFKVKGKRSDSTPLSSTGPANQPRNQGTHKMKGLTRGWYEATLEASKAGPDVSTFQRAKQFAREMQFTPGLMDDTVSADSAPTGTTTVSRKATLTTPPLEETWEGVPRGVQVPSSIPDMSPSVPRRGAGGGGTGHTKGNVLKPNIFGLMEAVPAKELRRREKIRQDNIQSTRRYRAGIPEPVEGIEEARDRIFRAEEEKYTGGPAASAAASSVDEFGKGLVTPSDYARVIPLDASLPFERQVHGRRLRDAKNLEAALEKALGEVSTEKLRKVVPAYRLKHQF